MRRILLVLTIAAAAVCLVPEIGAVGCFAQQVPAPQYPQYEVNQPIPVNGLPTDASVVRVTVNEVKSSGEFGDDDLVELKVFEFNPSDKTLNVKQRGALGPYVAFFVLKADPAKKVRSPLLFQLVTKKTVPPGLPIGGPQSDHDDLKNQLNVSDQDFKLLVVQMAKDWGRTSSDKTRRDYVARYDYTPVDTCRQIAAILRETGTGLDKQPDVATAESVMKIRFDQFYASGKKEFRTKNPYIEDWQPFLRELRTQVMKKIALQGKTADKDYFKVVLEELAKGFDELANDFLGVTTGSDPQSGNASGGTNQGSTTSDDCRRKRRRCRCSSLLFGI